MSSVEYGVAIHEAIASGDRTQMQNAARRAEAYLAQYGDLGAVIEILKSELAKRGALTSSGPSLIYGVVIHEAIASGDAARMQAVARQAEAHLAEYGNVGGALAALKAELAKR